MKQIQIDNKHFQLITDWSEVTPEVFLKIAYIRTQVATSTSEEFIQASRITLFFILSDVPVSYTRKIEPVQWADMLPHTDWAWKLPVLRSNPMPVLKVRLRVYHGPVSLMDTSTFGEFMQADNAFLSFMNDKKADAAWLLLAILWRPQRHDLREFESTPSQWNGDKREIYNTILAEKRAVFFKRRLPAYYATASVLYFEAVRTQKVVNNHLLQPLFQGSGSGAKLVTSKLGWLDTLLELAGAEPEKVDTTANQHWMLVLLTISRQIDKAQKQKS